jgi:hypothetical protein
MAELNGDMFLRALRRMLRPLVRALISQGVTAPKLYKLLKTIYVDVASEEFLIEGKAPTDSRISLLTGVHRRDIRSILDNPDDAWESARTKTTMMATVVGQWVTQPDYLTQDGAPKPLPMRAAEGESFESLVRSVNKDIRPRTVLDELLRQNLIEEDADGGLRIVEDALVGPKSDADKLVFFAANLGDHLAAASENLLSDTPPFYERAVFYNGLDAASVDGLEADAREKAQALLEDMNRASSSLQKQDRDSTEPKERFRLGIYFYRDGAAADDQDDKGGGHDG